MSTTRSSSSLAAPLAAVLASAAPRAATLALALAILAGCGSRGPSEEGSTAGNGAIGTVAPEFALPDLEGAVVKRSDLLGKVVILDFWATWCSPCRQEVPHFVELQSKYRDQGLAIVGLSLDAGGATVVSPFVEEYNVNYMMLIANDEAAKAYGGITGIPTTFVIDKTGKIVKRFMGYTAPEVFEEAIQPLLTAG